MDYDSARWRDKSRHIPYCATVGGIEVRFVLPEDGVPFRVNEDKVWNFTLE